MLSIVCRRKLLLFQRIEGPFDDERCNRSRFLLRSALISIIPIKDRKLVYKLARKLVELVELVGTGGAGKAGV